MSTGLVTTLAGSPERRGSVNGVGTAAAFGFPIFVAIDSAGTVALVVRVSNHSLAMALKQSLSHV